jgi:hypothetical protein
MEKVIITLSLLVCWLALSEWQVDCQPPNPPPRDDPPSRGYIETNFYPPEDGARRRDPELSATGGDAVSVKKFQN